MRSVSNFKFEHLSLRNVLRVINEPIHELSMLGWLRSVDFLNFLSELLELKTLKIDLLQTFHPWVFFSSTFESAF